MRLPMRRISRTAFPRRIERRIEGPEQEGAVDPSPFETLADDALFERLDVDRDVRQLGHEEASRRASSRRQR